MDLCSGQETSFQDGTSRDGFHGTSRDGFHVTSCDEYHVTGDLLGRAGIGPGRFHVGMLSRDVLDLGSYTRDITRVLALNPQPGWRGNGRGAYP